MDSTEWTATVPYRFLNWEQNCACGRTHRVSIRELILRSGVLADLPRLLSRLGPERKIHLVTHRAAWKALPFNLAAVLRDAGFQITSTAFDQDPLVPDEAAVEALDHGCPADTELALAVGSGVVHDLTRHLATRRGFEFDSVPTAPSMDGFASGVSPLLRGGFKETVPGKPPRAIWADLQVLAAAPAAMIAAGVGDLAGKAFCLRDWELGALLTHEYHCPFISQLMEESWARVRPLLVPIRQRQPEAIQTLMESLLLSGMGMVMTGNSRPASGAEHHLSHFWELRAHGEGRAPQLHGLKVGAAALLVAREVRRLRGNLGGPWNRSPAQRDPDALRASLLKAYGPLADSVFQESLAGDSLSVDPLDIEKILPLIQKVLGRFPRPQEVAHWLKLSGIPRSPRALGVTRREVRESLRYAPYLRNRYTVLRLRDQALVTSRGLKWLAIALVSANLALAAVMVGAGVVAASAWDGPSQGLRSLESRWTFQPRTGDWLVESRGQAGTYRSVWDGSRWVMSEVFGTTPESSHRSP